MAEVRRKRETYVELRARSAFSFLRGASQPEDLALRAADLGYEAVALGDHGGLYGMPRFSAAARQAGLRPIVAADVDVEGIGSLRLLVEDEKGYKNLCRLLTLAHARGPKGTHLAYLDEVAEHAQGLFVLLGACRDAEAADAAVRRLGRERVAAEVCRYLDPAQERWNRVMVHLSEHHGIPLVATGDVRHAFERERRILDVLTCIREGVTLEQAKTLLLRNAERYLKPPAQMRRLFADLPRAVEETRRIAERCAFSFEDLPYAFPDYPTPPGETQQSLLEKLTWEGARRRYGKRLDAKVRAQLEHELAIIGKLDLAGYFLIVWDIVRFCNESGILAQGRGSAANSAVCYSLGITAVDPVGMELLFERFLSEERGEWPDIDLDLPSGEKREAVIQYVYQRYGRDRAAMCAEVITYKGRSSVREVGKVLGIAPDVIDRLARGHSRFEYQEEVSHGERLSQLGLPAKDERLRLLLELCDEIRELPRHLSQHSGGMIIAKGRLDEVVPLEPAAMPDRTVLQWDKDDCERLGLIKIDLLGLGMMAALEEAMEILRQRGTPVDLSQLPHDDPAVYEAACRADTVGVFQIESRAQMATLPRMKPRRFYDLVVEVGLIRPGPIVGKMVHPYLNRRAGREPVTYAHPSLKPILERTLGIPLFQEQLMRVAMVAADFSGSEAQELRRAMSHKRSREMMRRFEERLREGMAKNGFSPEAAEEVITGIRSFAEYGFPESHAASFALLVYASLWLKVHHPAVFLAALLNNQPMGFYAPATLVKDAQRHGVRVRPPCVVESEVGAKVTADREVRLGLLSVVGLGKAAAQRIVEARAERPFSDAVDVCLRAGLDLGRAETLAEAGAFAALGLSRRQALWAVRAALSGAGPLAPPASDASPLPEMNEWERTLADYTATGLTVGPHLVGRLREALRARGVVPARTVPSIPHGRRIRIGGQVIVRQRPGTAKGMVFITLEDETGLANAAVDPKTFDRNRLVILQSPLLVIEGKLQNLEGVATVKGERFFPLDLILEDLPPSRDFH
ncbi:MAG: error-prone DNA polymerase [Pseudomonadota bacterium]